jgi:deoxyribodipyrimidine photo-lyase
MTMNAPVILWFRQDLRLVDQPALVAAVETGRPVIPVFVLDDEGPGAYAPAGASRWWLHHSLIALDASLRAKGSRLVLRRGHSADVIAAIAAETGASAVHAVRHYEPWHKQAAADIALRLPLHLHEGLVLCPPALVLSGTGSRYRMFTPWWKALLHHMPPPKPLAAPERIVAPAHWPDGEELAQWALLPRQPDWAAGFHDHWQPGEDAARQRLRDFLPHLGRYQEDRNFPGIATGISRLSPHLHFGEISPALVWHLAARDAGEAAAPFLREVGWRDFGINMIDQWPGYGWVDGRAASSGFPWRQPEQDAEAARDLRAWQQGLTGYPIIDAGMRELWATGYVHNRIRMLVASFLVKHLLIDWRHGERWFWDTLVDADYGNNAMGWQWIAGTGFESNPFGRIMAPLGQSEKFDCGDYIRRWVPELSHVGEPHVHDPEEFGLRLPGYPAKIIGHQQARARALAASARLQKN